MKTFRLFIVLMVWLSTNLMAQQTVMFRLTNSQVQNLRVEREQEGVSVLFQHPAAEKVLEKVKMKRFYQSYPNASSFNHPASERVARLFTIEGQFNELDLIQELKDANFSDYIVPGGEYLFTFTPNDFGQNDPIYQQSFLNKIKAKQAWDITKGSSSIKIAVIDNGFKPSHEDLNTQIVFQEANVITGQIHGNATAGAAAAATDNGIGLSSIGFNSKLMLYLMGSDPFAKILTASQNGADVINCSWITLTCGYVQHQQDIIDMATANGSIIVASAGNGNAAHHATRTGLHIPLPTQMLFLSRELTMIHTSATTAPGLHSIQLLT